MSADRAVLERLEQLEAELNALRASVAAAPPAEPLPEAFEALQVAVGELELALPLDGVIEVVPRVLLVPEPDAPEHSAGHMRWRGRHVAVTDLGSRWTGEALPVRLEDRIVVVLHDGRHHGLLVSAASGVARLRAADVSEPAAGRAASVSLGLAQVDGRSVSVVSLARLLRERGDAVPDPAA